MEDKNINVCNRFNIPCIGIRIISNNEIISEPLNKERAIDCLFKMDMEEVKKQDGKIFLAIEKNEIVGLIIGSVAELDEVDKLTNDCAKVGNVLELIVKNGVPIYL